MLSANLTHINQFRIIEGTHLKFVYKNDFLIINFLIFNKKKTKFFYNFFHKHFYVHYRSIFLHSIILSDKSLKEEAYMHLHMSSETSHNRTPPLTGHIFLIQAVH